MKVNITFIHIFIFCAMSFSQTETGIMPEWQEGILDIHHIKTGRGNATFCIFPDGTTLLIDVGDMSELHPRVMSPRNCEKSIGNYASVPSYIAGYILNVFPGAKPKGIDFALITHYHDDHFGEADSTRKLSADGYLLTGITEVGTLLKITRLIDRGFEEPVNLLSGDFIEKYRQDEYHIVQTLEAYKQFIDVQKKHGLIHQQFKAGSSSQIVMMTKPDKYADFKVRNLFGSGWIWHGSGDSCFEAMPSGIYPGENPLSLGIKISYGKFDYYTGGDIAGMNRLGLPDDMSMEALAAPVVGSVDVAILNHHGSRDSQSPVWVRTLRPRVWVQQNWSSDHPGHEVLNRVVSEKLYPGDRDLYALCMTETTKNYIGGMINRYYKSTCGHVLVRVYETGEFYDVFVLEDNSGNYNIKLSGRYYSK
ncbi:MAG: MBL fold metallo-hydrolase [Bacteroidales bacterium]|nr:MBL fold metallo-hydrolase [Bacteroidales bacterium]